MDKRLRDLDPENGTVPASARIAIDDPSYGEAKSIAVASIGGGVGNDRVIWDSTLLASVPAELRFVTFAEAYAALNVERGGLIEVRSPGTVAAASYDMSLVQIEGTPMLPLSTPTLKISMADGAIFLNPIRLKGVEIEPVGAGTPPVIFSLTCVCRLEAASLTGVAGRAAFQINAGVTLFALSSVGTNVGAGGEIAGNVEGTLIVVAGGGLIQSNALSGSGSLTLVYATAGANVGGTQGALTGGVNVVRQASVTTLSDVMPPSTPDVPVFRWNGVDDTSSGSYAQLDDAIDAIGDSFEFGSIRWEDQNAPQNIIHDCTDVEMLGRSSSAERITAVADFNTQFANPPLWDRINMVAGGLGAPPRLDYDAAGLYVVRDSDLSAPAGGAFVMQANATCTVRFEGKCVIGDGINAAVAVQNGVSCEFVIGPNVTLMPGWLLAAGGSRSIRYLGPRGGHKTVALTPYTLQAEDENRVLYFDTDSVGGDMTVNVPIGLAAGGQFKLKKLGTGGDVLPVGVGVTLSAPVVPPNITAENGIATIVIGEDAITADVDGRI